MGSTSDVEQCLLESSHNDGWTHKQRYRSKVPSVVTTRVRPCQAVLEEDTDALNDSVHWCLCVCVCGWEGVNTAGHVEILKTQEERREMAGIIERDL